MRWEPTLFTNFTFIKNQVLVLIFGTANHVSYWIVLLISQMFYILF